MEAIFQAMSRCVPCICLTSSFHICYETRSLLCGSYQISVFFVLYSLTLLSRLVFWLHNLLCFAFVDIYHGLVVPLRFLLVNTQNYFNDYLIHQHHCWSHHEHQHYQRHCDLWTLFTSTLRMTIIVTIFLFPDLSFWQISTVLTQCLFSSFA